MTDDSDKKDRPEGSGAQGLSPGEQGPTWSSAQSGLIGTTISHYRIEAHIGRGGMGVVYRASDLKLDRFVALKFLPSFQQGGENAHDRFVAEARAASGLDHPNICTIYEIGDADPGETFIAMAYYEGETLKEKIAAASMDVDEAIEYATQVARGLSSAHEAGIVHRDIKPANIIITPEGVAKILDFGLSKVEDQQLTRTGELLGTLDYMSPEQVSGEDVDAQTDIWALGAMLFEMLTGERPFHAGNQAAVLYSVLHQEAPSVSVTNPAVSSGVGHIVHMCLEKDKSRRFSNAQTLVDALEGRDPASTSGVAARQPRTRGIGPAPQTPLELTATTDAGTPQHAEPSREARPGRSKRVAVGAIVVAAIAAITFAIPATRTGILGLRPAVASASTARFLAVIPMSGGPQEDENLAEGLTHVLTGELAKLDSVVVLSAAEVLNQSNRTAQEIHRLYSVDAIVTVAVERLGRTRVRLTLVDPDLMQDQSVAYLPMPNSDFEAFEDSIPGALAALMGVEPQAVIGESLIGTENAAAFNYYAQGRGYLARFNEAGNVERSITLFEQALALDSLYAPAHAAICEARFEQFQFRQDPHFVELARPSCDDAIRLGGGLPQVLVPVASVYLRTGRPEEARQALESARIQDPLNPDVHHWLAEVFDETGEPERARASIEEAIRLNPRNWRYHTALAGYLLYRGEFAASIPHWEEVRNLAPDNFFGELGLSGALTWQNDIERAKALLEPLVDSQAHVRAYSNLGYLYFHENEYAEGVKVLQEGTELFDNDVFLWRFLAHNAYWDDQQGLAETAWKRVVEIGETVFSVNPRQVDVLGALAEAYAQLGDPVRSREYLDLLSFEPKKWAYHVYHQGRTLEMLDSRPAALRHIEQAFGAGWDLLTAERDPWLADLRQDPLWNDIADQALNR